MKLIIGLNNNEIVMSTYVRITKKNANKKLLMCEYHNICYNTLTTIFQLVLHTSDKRMPTLYTQYDNHIATIQRQYYKYIAPINHS